LPDDGNIAETCSKVLTINITIVLPTSVIFYSHVYDFLNAYAVKNKTSRMENMFRQGFHQLNAPVIKALKYSKTV
jgi:hypothetical protein